MRKKTKKKRALANEIADAIHVGDYRPGEWLRQIDLEHKYGATRFDVRTALEELVVRKAIQHVPNRGYRVMILDEEALAVIREVRLIVECAAARIVAMQADAAALTELRRHAELFTAAIDSGTVADQSRTNREFHRLFYAACGNPVLEETIWALRERARASHLTIWQSHQALRQANDGHYQMLDAIQSRDPDLLAEIVARHIERKHEDAELRGMRNATRSPAVSHNLSSSSSIPES